MLEIKQQHDETQLTDNEKLRHEVDYLHERLKNLEVFKKMFFTLQEDLVEERKKYSELKASLNKDTHVEDDSDGVQSDQAQVSVNIDSLKEELLSANQMATLSMTTAGEYGAIIDFFRESGLATNYQDMVQMLLAAGTSYGCGVSVEVRCNEGDLIFSYDDSIKDEKAAIITRLKLQGRLVEEDQHFCINFRNISLLIDNLPKNDIDKYERIKDNLVVLASGANSVVESIDSKVKLKKERKNLYKIVKGTHHAMEKIEKDIGEQIRKTSTTQNAFIKGLAEAVTHSKLREEEKNKLNVMLTSGKKTLSKVLMESFVLDENFLEVITKLEKTYSVVESAKKSERGKKEEARVKKYT